MRNTGDIQSEGSQSLPAFPHHTQFSREFQLVAACSWIAPSGLIHHQTETIIAILDGKIDWEHLVHLTDRHRVQLLVYAALSRHSSERVPEHVLQQLKDRSLKCRMQALMNAAELTRLCRLFDNNGIKAMPLKGVALSLSLFGDVGIRQARDLDILIKPHDLDQAYRILESEGYRTSSLNFTMTPKQHNSFIRHFHHFEFVNGSGSCVELHWNLYAWPTELVELI